MAKEREGFYARAYDLNGPDEVKDLYSQWAKIYDSDMQDYRYIQPQKTAEVLRRYLKDHDSHILDAGCGTGLVGMELKKDPAFNHISGTDISPDMLVECRTKNLYENLFEANIMSDSMPCPAQSFDAAISVGTYTLTHVLPKGLLQLFHVVKDGGLLFVAINELAWHQDKYMRAIGEFEESKKCEVIEITKLDKFNEAMIGCYIVVLKVLH